MSLDDWQYFGDWKYFGDGDWYRGDKYSYARVWKIGLSSQERKRRGIGVYGFSGRFGRNGIITKKYFKTKPQAFKFAKVWMRRN